MLELHLELISKMKKSLIEKGKKFNAVSYLNDEKKKLIQLSYLRKKQFYLGFPEHSLQPVHKYSYLILQNKNKHCE